MNEKIKKTFFALMTVSFFSGALADESQTGQSAEALAAPPASLPRITNTIARQHHQPIATASNLPIPTTSATSVSAKLTTATAWPDPMPSQLVVIASPPQVTGEKAIVKLAMKNGLAKEIESARAAIFLLDEQGKMVSQASKWVIAGASSTATGNKSGLSAGATDSFYFVITTSKPFTSTNLTAKVAFNRIVLNGGIVGDVERDVLVQNIK